MTYCDDEYNRYSNRYHRESEDVDIEEVALRLRVGTRGMEMLELGERKRITEVEEAERDEKQRLRRVEEEKMMKGNMKRCEGCWKYFEGIGRHRKKFEGRVYRVSISSLSG